MNESHRLPKIAPRLVETKPQNSPQPYREDTHSFNTVGLCEVRGRNGPSTAITHSGCFHFGPQRPFHAHENENTLSELLLLWVKQTGIHTSSNYRQQNPSMDFVAGSWICQTNHLDFQGWGAFWTSVLQREAKSSQSVTGSFSTQTLYSQNHDAET